MSGGPGSAPLAPDPILPPTRALVFSRLPRSPPHLPRVPIQGPSQQRSVQRWARALRGGAAGEVGPGAEALQPVCVPQSGAAPADLLACMFMRVCVRACASACRWACVHTACSRGLASLASRGQRHTGQSLAPRPSRPSLQVTATAPGPARCCWLLRVPSQTPSALSPCQ